MPPQQFASEVLWKCWFSGGVSRADDQRVLLRASKLLHQVLACQRLPHRPERFLIHQPHRTPARGVLRATATVVRLFARTRVSRIAGVQRAVRATDDVDKVHAPIVAGSAPPGKSPIQNRPSPGSDSSRRRSGDGRQPDGVGDQAKMMSRGRGRRASRLVPGNGGAPAPAVARRPVHRGPAGAARRARRHARTHPLDAALLQPGLQVSRVRAHRAWRRSPRQCSCHDFGAGSLPRGRERTGTGA